MNIWVQLADKAIVFVLNVHNLKHTYRDTHIMKKKETTIDRLHFVSQAHLHRYVCD